MRMVGVRRCWTASSLTTETIQSTALALESVDDIERGDGLALGVLAFVSRDRISGVSGIPRCR